MIIIVNDKPQHIFIKMITWPLVFMERNRFSWCYFLFLVINFWIFGLNHVPSVMHLLYVTSFSSLYHIAYRNIDLCLHPQLVKNEAWGNWFPQRRKRYPDIRVALQRSRVSKNCPWNAVSASVADCTADIWFKLFVTVFIFYWL